MHSRPLPSPHRPAILRQACPRSTTAMLTLIANHLWGVRISTRRAIYHHPSVSHHRRRVRQAEEAAAATSAHCHNNMAPAHIPINLPYPRHSHKIHPYLPHSHMQPCPLKRAAQVQAQADTRQRAPRPTDRLRAPYRRRSLAQAQDQVDRGDARSRRARRADRALQSVVGPPGSRPDPRLPPVYMTRR